MPRRRRAIGFYTDDEGRTRPITGRRIKKKRKPIIRRRERPRGGREMTVYLTKEAIETILRRVLRETSEYGGLRSVLGFSIPICWS